MRSHSAFILGEGGEPTAGVDRLSPEPLDRRLVDHALQPSAMDRELRHVVAGVEPALLVPDLLAASGEIEQLRGADRDIIEPFQQAELAKLADRMRQRVD